MQNAPYHHVRGVPSLASITTKKHMADLIENTLVKPPIEGVQPVTHLTFPVKTGTRDTALSVPISEITKDIEEGIRAAASKPRVPSGEELKEVWLQAMKNHADQGMRQLLGCKLERYLETELGAEFLWTPPYTPTLQPIEEFWGGGKNYVASLYTNGRKMREVVEQLRIGWYGDGANKKPLPCDRLVSHAMDDADRRMQEVGGLLGSMRTGVTAVVGAKLITNALGNVAPLPNDMQTVQQTVPEPVDLTRDDEVADGAAADGAAADAPLVLEEDDHLAAVAAELAEGTALVVDPDDESAPAPNAPPDSPAAAAHARSRSQRKGAGRRTIRLGWDD